MVKCDVVSCKLKKDRKIRKSGAEEVNKEDG